MSSNVPVGVYRTYVHIPEDEEFNYSNWCKNLKLGNTFFSGGPIIRFQVEGKPIGSTIQLPVNGGTVEVEAIAESIFPVHSLEIIQEGRVVASTGDSKGTRKLRINAPIKLARHSWLAARCGGPQLTDGIVHHEGWKRGIIAHTSPVYIAVGGTGGCTTKRQLITCVPWSKAVCHISETSLASINMILLHTIIMRTITRPILNVHFSRHYKRFTKGCINWESSISL